MTPSGEKPTLSARIELRHKVHVLTKREELDSVRIEGKVVVVLDILFASSTMVTALAHGAEAVLPVADEASARAAAQALPAGSFVLSGELYAERLPGFAHPAPLSLVEHGVAGKTVVYSTTNGTVALTGCEGAAAVYCGALLNAQALCAHLAERHRRDTILLLCAGSGGNFNFEDFYGAGCLVERLAGQAGPGADLSDAARAAALVYRHARAPDALLDCRVGRLMVSKGLRHEVEFASREDAFAVVPVLRGGRLAPA